MNLLYTLTAYPPFIGGAQLQQHQLARQLIKHHSVKIATQWDASRRDWLLGTTLRAPYPARCYEIDGVPVRRITLSPAVKRGLVPWVSAYYILQQPAISRISDALASEIAPLAVGVDLIHNVRIGREGLSYASLNLARRHDIPFVFTPVHHPRWGSWWHRSYHRLYRQADAVIALTESERRTLVGLGVDERRIFVLGVGPVIADSHDGKRFRSIYGLGNTRFVLFLGQKYAYKGLELLLQAARIVWSRLPETHFVFIGPRTGYSNRLFGGVNDRRIVELDSVNLQVKTDALAACDVLCLPSSQESFGGVFTEAWSLAKPVVGCDIPAVRDVVDEERDGYLVPPNPGPLAERIVYLLENPAIAQRMGEHGREKVSRLYTWPRLAARLEQAYRRVLQAR